LIAAFSPYSFGQHLPPLHPVNVLSFTIPFEKEEGAASIKEVELLVSKDRGRRWHSVARQSAESGKFAFHADSDGEYWFAFRTITMTGNVSPMNGQPQLRVLVNTQNSMVALPSQPSETGPLTPPRPERFRTGNRLTDNRATDTYSAGNEMRPQPQSQPQSTQPANNSVPRNNELRNSEPNNSEEEPQPERTGTERENTEMSARILAPRFPGFESSEPARNHESNLLDDLLSGMSSFMDVQPVAVSPIERKPVEISRAIPDNRVASAAPNLSSLNPPNPNTSHPSIPTSSVNTKAGSIAGIVLNNTETSPQIIVRWNTGDEFWKDAQIDVLRSSTQEGQWSPIAINLPNSGEYWWFLTPEDLKPFYIAVRIRSLHGGIQMDITQKVIEIDPRLSQFQGAHP
jgi:hypothetical protein